MKRIKRAGPYFTVVSGPYPHYGEQELTHYFSREEAARIVAENHCGFLNFVRLYNKYGRLIYKWDRRQHGG